MTTSAWHFAAIGTSWQVHTADPLSAAARAAVSGVVEQFDRDWSRFRPDSVVTALAAAGGTVPAPRDAAVLLDAYAAVAAATAGAVNPLVGDALSRRGYDPGYTLIDRGATAAPAHWREQLTWDEHTLTLTPGATIDVGALGKGRLVDRVGEIVAAHTDKGFVVDASGDLLVRGAAERVGLEHPFDPSRAIGVWEVADTALCASATNRRAWGDGLHHVLDARTGEPVRTIAATWACASSAMRADAVTTALFFKGGPRLAAAWGIPWVRMTTDGGLEWSPGCDADLFVPR